MIKHIQFICMGILMLTGCTPKLIPAPTSTPNGAGIPVPTKPLIHPTDETSQTKMLDLAIKDLSVRFSLGLDMIHLIQAESALWQDSSLGCPQLGEEYVQAVVEGYVFLLEVNNQIYEYHTDNNDHVILCREKNLPTFPVTPGEIEDGQPWMPVD